MLFGGLNGLLGSKVFRVEPPSISFCSSCTVAKPLSSLGSGALRTTATDAAGGSSADFLSTSGTATSPASSSTATGQRRLARRSAQTLFRKFFMT